MDLLHRRSLVGFARPTARHKPPQIFGVDALPGVLADWPRGILFVGKHRPHDFGVAKELGEWSLFRDTYKHHHCKGECIRTCRCGDVVVFEEFRG